MISISPKTIIKSIIVLMAVASVFLFFKWREALARESAVVDYAKAKDQEIVYYKNALGEQVAKTDAIILEVKSLKKLAEDQHLQWLKEFEGVKKNLRNVEVATKLNTETIAELTGEIGDTTIYVGNDSIPAFSFDTSNEWISLKGLVVPSLKKVTTDLKVNVPIEGVLNWERKKILGLRIGRKQYKFQVKSKNPYTTITGAEQILIQ